MSGRCPSCERIARGRFLRDESGATLVEFAIVCSLFLLIFFGLIDFGRLGYSWVMAEKAMQRAARIAAVRPPVCPGLAISHERDPEALIIYEFGESCGTGPNICLAVSAECLGTAAVDGSAGDTTANEVWASIGGLMPPGTTLANVRFTYASDPSLGFLGGPLVPVVTTELDGATFQFVSPLGGLARLAGATDAEDFGTIVLPPMAVSLPGEDLAQGNDG